MLEMDYTCGNTAVQSTLSTIYKKLKKERCMSQDMKK